MHIYVEIFVGREVSNYLGYVPRSRILGSHSVLVNFRNPGPKQITHSKDWMAYLAQGLGRFSLWLASFKLEECGEQSVHCIGSGKRWTGQSHRWERNVPRHGPKYPHSFSWVLPPNDTISYELIRGAIRWWDQASDTLVIPLGISYPGQVDRIKWHIHESLANFVKLSDNFAKQSHHIRSPKAID